PNTRGVHGLVAPLGHAETDRDALGRLRGQDTWGDAVSWLADAWARAPAVRLLPHRVMAHRVRRRAPPALDRQGARRGGGSGPSARPARPVSARASPTART